MFNTLKYKNTFFYYCILFVRIHSEIAAPNIKVQQSHVLNLLSININLMSKHVFNNRSDNISSADRAICNDQMLND